MATAGQLGECPGGGSALPRFPGRTGLPAAGDALGCVTSAARVSFCRRHEESMPRAALCSREGEVRRATQARTPRSLDQAQPSACITGGTAWSPRSCPGLDPCTPSALRSVVPRWPGELAHPVTAWEAPTGGPRGGRAPLFL